MRVEGGATGWGSRGATWLDIRGGPDICCVRGGMCHGWLGSSLQSPLRIWGLGFRIWGLGFRVWG